MSESADAFLEHHGVKGMKWGVRRSRSDSGGDKHGKTGGYTRTPKESADSRHARLAQQKIARGGLQTLNNKELQSLVKRQNLEKQYSDLNPMKTSEGKKLAQAMLSTLGPIAVATAISVGKKYATQRPSKQPGTALVLHNPQDIQRRKMRETVMGTGAQMAKQFGPKVFEVVAKSLIS